MRYFSVIFLFIFSSSFLLSQQQRKAYADKQFNLLQYYYAAEGYEDVLERTGDSLSLVPNIAISYDKIGNAEKAVVWYDFMYRNERIDSLGLLRLGLLQRTMERYDVSYRVFQEHSKKYGATDLTGRIFEGSHLLSDLQEGDGNFSVKDLSLHPTFSDMSVAYYREGEVVITSSQRDFLPFRRVYGWTGDYYYNLYKGNVSEGGDITGLKQLKGDVRSKFHESYFSYDQKNDWVYFTRNNYLGGTSYDADKGVRLKIYRAKVQEDKFVDVEELPFNSDLYSCAHPSVSSDGNTLYFVSDMPGGYGGTDVYFVDLSGGKFGEPQNLGDKVNTSSDEVTPFFHSEDQILFFSSEGHVGLGGFDVFVAKLASTGEVKSVANLGSPINSPQDDISFVNNLDQTAGYLSSNRGGGVDNIFTFSQARSIRSTKVVEGYAFDLLTLDTLSGVNIVLKDSQGAVISSVQSDSLGFYTLELPEDGTVEESFSIHTAETDFYKPFEQDVVFNSSTDIYSLDVGLGPVNKLLLSGVVSNSETQGKIDRARISIINAVTGDTLQQVFTNPDGFFVAEEIVSENNIDLEIIVDKDGFHDRVERVRKEFGGARDVDLDLSLTPSVDLVNVLALKPIYFLLNSSNIEKRSHIELDKVVNWLKENPTERVEIRSHTDAQGTDKYNDWLSERRAASTVDYIVGKGISRDRVSGKGYGERRLIISSEEIDKLKTQKEKDAMHQLNRRSEFIIVED